MKKILVILVFFSLCSFTSARKKDSEKFASLPNISLNKLSFGTDRTFEVVTWNLEHFPKNDVITINFVANILTDVDADVIGLQEIESDSSFIILIEKLNKINKDNHWKGFRSVSDKWNLNLAYLYKSNVVKVNKIYEIYKSEDDDYAFPRSPLVMELSYHKTPIVIINNHLKARGGKKNEARRRAASKKLDKFVKTNYDRDNVIIIGDWNDQLSDLKQENVFWNLISNIDDYEFTDMSIAADSTADWSYPYWPSHLDHILISNELFDEFNCKSSEIKTITIDKYLEGGWDSHYKYISDHRPVALKLYFNQ